MRIPVITALTAVSLVTVRDAAAQPAGGGGSGTELQPIASENLNRFGFCYPMGFNISASLRNLGGYGLPGQSANPGRTPNNDPYNYDNGYIYQDYQYGHGDSHPGYTYYYGYTAGTPQRPADAPTDFDLSRSTSAPRTS